ncbi:methylated-DNA--[protein]-cysteine S-methyltransferase [Caldibacillus lycopersici]|uniref:Methylated-DNA--protein-cysteine methyltransferase n=1 Tax=Perspicuibacillus lycopersici TaxID=1325689 RepID=A0AAE3LLF7_9BACI|nr:methylated-DNA--[protein]-cysteine S-methyltransferase [Perspicuibacillus lycopersici]MCU9612295.1 methylated-DNA--[protein]-cysteine S-methyltransferase [Perspicuibacillus lycopersici]
MLYYSKMDSPIDKIYIVAADEKICALFLGEEDFQEWAVQRELVDGRNYRILLEAKKQLEEYFARERRSFELPITFGGTVFQQSVWKSLLNIPYGETRSYQFIAEKIGNPKAVRAIGQANRANNLPIIIPCHRVIGKNGKLTGYAGTRTDIKEKLLQLEGNR